MTVEGTDTMNRHPTHKEIVSSMEMTFKGDLTQRLQHLYNLKHTEHYKPEVHHRDGTRYVVEVHGATHERNNKLKSNIEYGNATFVDENGDLVGIHGHNGIVNKSYIVKGFDLVKMINLEALNQEEMVRVLGSNKCVEAHMAKSGLKIVKTKEPLKYTVLGFDNKPMIDSRHKLAMVDGVMYSIYGGNIVDDVPFPRNSF